MLRKLQQNDTSLSKVRQSANSDVDCSTDTGKSYYWHDGLLYCRWKPCGQDAEMVVNQLVLQQCRGKVLGLAYSIPLVGYLSKEKTRHRISTGLHCIMTLKSLTVVVLSVRSPLNKECLKPLMYHYQLSLPHFRR